MLKIWWIFNSIAFINLFLVYLSNVTGTSLYNNPLTHFIYNITSVFIVIPWNLASILFAAAGNHPAYIQRGDLNSVYLFLGIVLVLALLVNLLIAKAVLSRKASAVYNRYLKPRPFWILVGVALIILAFAIF